MTEITNVGINISWIAIPGTPFTTPDKTYGIGDICGASVIESMNAPTIEHNLPNTIDIIKDIYIFFVFLNNNPVINPYPSNSSAIIGIMGINGGIPVKTLDSTGVINPILAPYDGPSINPPIITGKCIGENILPDKFTVWNIVGKINPIAIKSADNIIFLVFILILSPLNFK